MNKSITTTTVRSTQGKARSQKPTQKIVISQQKKQRKRNRNGNPRSSPYKPQLHLSPCAVAYAKAKLDPFNYGSNDLPCIPDVIDIPSYKFCTIQRGAIIQPTAPGSPGFIWVAPKVNSNDQWYSGYTIAGYAGTTVTATDPTTGVAYLADAKYPYSSTSKRQMRVVACGLRVRYTGTELDRGGSIVLFSNNTGASFMGMTFAQMTNLPGAWVVPVTRQWSSVLWNSAVYSDYQYGTNVAIPHTNPEEVKLIAMMTSKPGNTFEFEIVRYIEMCDGGPALPVPVTTMSHSDPVGLGIVKDFLSDRNVQDLGKGALNSFLTFAKEGAAAYASSYFGPAASLLALPWKP